MNDAQDHTFPGQAAQNAHTMPGFDPFHGIYTQLQQFGERTQQFDERLTQFTDLIQQLGEQVQSAFERLQKLEDLIQKPLDPKQRRRINAINEYDRRVKEGSLTRDHLRVLRRACKVWAGKGEAYNEADTFAVPESERALWMDLVQMEFARRVPSPKGTSAPYCTITDFGRSITRHDVLLRGK